jgi:peptidoglycan/LPS O-acetylase OafA/YrhL
MPRLLSAPLHTLGVYIFFIISGYLITKSWLRAARLAHYLRNRLLRILPGLFAVVLFSVFTLGPVASTLSTAHHFDDDGTWRYLLNMALRPVYVLPGVFEVLPHPRSVNGSLWTLPVEFFCYLIVPVILSLPARARWVGAAIFGVVSIAMELLVTDPLAAYGVSVTQAAPLWAFFAGGMLVALLLDARMLRLDLA